MREIHRSALVPHTPQQMFDLVADFGHYPTFVPWVVEAQVLSQTPTEVVGRLTMERAGLRESFATRNTLEPPHSIRMEMVEGPFRTLDGVWRFAPIGERGTRISLDMRFEFANPLTGLLLSKTFERSINQLMDAFIARARQQADER